MRWARKWAYSPKLATYLVQQAVSTDIIHMHSMWLYPNLAGSRAARRAGTPYIVRPAGSLEPWSLENRKLKKKLYLSLISRRILNGAARIHAVSPQEAGRIETFGFKSPVIMVPNGVQIRDIRLQESKKSALMALNWPRARKRILFLGRIDPKKGVELLLKAFSLIDAESLDARLVFVGPDDHHYAQGIKAKASRMRESSRIHFVGELLGERKWRAFRAADIFVLPSYSENFGNAVLEALSVGTPVAVSQNTPWESVRQRGAGYWLPRETNAFAEAILKVISSEELHSSMSRAAIDLASEFSWESVSSRMTEVYNDVLVETCSQPGIGKS